MKFFIHLGTNLEYFKLLNEWFLLSQGKKDREVADFFVQNFPWELAETISPQYEINFMSLREIRKKFWVDAFNKIEGIYYGSDNCEFLLARKKELVEAIEQFREFDKKYPPHTIRTFVFVTPYIWNALLPALEESLDYLNNLKIKNPIEVVVNDFGTLRLLTTKYTRLKPIFWRLIHKLLKTPLIDSFWYDVHPSGEAIKNKTSQEIEIMKAEIIKWQIKFYNSAEISLEELQNFLKRYDIERVALDYIEKRGNLYDNKRFWDFGIDLYYPWSIVFTWRLCDTASIENPSKGYYATDDICPRTCNRYDIFYKIKTSYYKLIQRGNAGFRSSINLDYLSEDFVKNENNRFIYAPFVSV